MASQTASGGGLESFDQANLFAFLDKRLPGFADRDLVEVTQFSGGQSNPTYCLSTPAGRYVMRKKPAGNLLPSAHAIDREYRIISALAGHFPVPSARLFCDDENVIGQPFYLMDHVEGRVLHDARMLDVPHANREAYCLELVGTLARLHSLNFHELGLDGFGKPGSYIQRQISRMIRQYESARVEDNADMQLIIHWLCSHPPIDEEISIVHGDYRSYNVIFAKHQPCISAVLDWELTTIGHPLADLAFCCLPYHMPADDLRGFQGADPNSLGIPTEAALIQHYCRESGREQLPNWRFFLVFSLFRSAAIRAGVYRRALDGTAASADALEMGMRYRDSAAAAAGLIRNGPAHLE
jgi:aminoglycoside phosphotransferase (APT) family kinase protein